MSTVPSNASPQPALTTLKAAGPEGIGGWMILPIIGFIGVIVLTLFNLFQPDALEAFRVIFGGGSEELRSLQLPIGLSTLFGIAVIFSGASCLILLFRKKRMIVPVTTVHYLILMMAGFIDLWGEYRIQDLDPSQAVDASSIKEAVRGLVIAVVWIPYFRLSRRVRNTCVR